MLPWKPAPAKSPAAKRTVFAAMILSLSLAPLSAQAASPVAPAYTLSPSAAAAGQTFTLSLLGGSFGCANSFSRESVTVTDKRIDLSFVANYGYIIDPPVLVNGANADTAPKSAIVCPVYDKKIQSAAAMPIYSNSPTFAMPALKAGTYDVWATQMYECQFSKPACMIASQQLYAGQLTITPEGSITYTVNPTQTAAGKEFSLELLSYQFNCANTFDMLASSVDGNTISLTFLDHMKVGIMCPAIYKPYGPTYKMAALSAGTYKVKAYRLPACAAQGCAMAPVAVDAGTLTVLGSVMREGWFLNPRTVSPNLPFALKLFNFKYGNCQTSFSHQSISVQNGEIWASFLAENHPDNVCIQNVVPYGPTFDMDAMKPGDYPVRVTELLACQVTAPFCPIARLIPPPSDTLTVAKTTAVRLLGQSLASPTAAFQGRRLNLALPAAAAPTAGSTGTWSAELMTPSGRVLAVYKVEGVDARMGGTAGFDAGARIERGVYLLRLHGPAGETHTLPLVRKD